MLFTSVNNFFDDPDLLRQIALDADYRVNESDDPDDEGWKGMRTLPLRELNNDFLDDCTERVYEYLMDYGDFTNYVYPKSAGLPELAGRKPRDLVLTTYFHIVTNNLKNAYQDFWVERFHQDHLPFAGVVYLTPDAPVECGTSILDAKNSRIRNVYNEYNKLVAYDGYALHGVSDTFGDDKKSGRLTFTFFLHEQDFTEDFD